MANYAERVLNDLKVRYANEPEFLQAATEILTTLKPVIDRNEEKYEKVALLESFVEHSVDIFYCLRGNCIPIFCGLPKAVVEVLD